MTDPTVNTRLTELFESHYDEVLAYCARRIGRDDAEDAAAEVFVVALRRADEIDWTTVRSWLFGISRGVLANRWRSARRRQRVFGVLTELATPPQDGPDELVVRNAEDGRAISALRRMNPTDREVLMLAAWEDLTGPEIARALDISVAAAEQRLHRAKQRFAQTIERRANAVNRLGVTDERGA